MSEDTGITVISKDLDAFVGVLESQWGVGVSVLLGHFRQQHKLIAEAMRLDSMDAFRAAADPETGAPWAPLAWSTLKSRLGKSRGATIKKLIGRNARLRNSITRESTGEEAAIGTNLVYARIHQLGGEAGRKGARVTIPARPYMGIGRAATSAIEHAMGVLGGRL